MSDLDKRDLLPDSRLKTIVTPKGMIQGPGGMWVPVFCANCGVFACMCPAANMTFMFYLCNPCFKQWGHLTNTLVMPDEVFWRKLRDEMLESHGKALTEAELAAAIEADPSSPLALLVKSRKE